MLKTNNVYVRPGIASMHKALSTMPATFVEWFKDSGKGWEMVGKKKGRT